MPDAFLAIQVIRWMATVPGYGRLKGISETDARRLVAEFGGTVAWQPVTLLPGGREILDPWVEVANDQ